MKPLGWQGSYPSSSWDGKQKRCGRAVEKNFVLAVVEAELEEIKEERIWESPYGDCDCPDCILCVESEIRMMWNELRDTNSVYQS